jgi:putative oxidoreductase
MAEPIAMPLRFAHVARHALARELLGLVLMNPLAPIGRVLFSLIFVLSVPNLFKAATIAYAASAGVPLANIAVPLAGILALVGGLSIALGFHARVGAIALLVFLVPVTLYMHTFWGLSDPQAVQLQQAHFMKNLALMGGALFFVYAGAGAYSLDARAHRTPGLLSAGGSW